MNKSPVDTNEKAVAMELKKTVRQLYESRDTAIRTMAETISLAADAGDIILSARTEGLDVEGILQVAEVTQEQSRRLERVAKARPSLTNPEPGQLKQLALWAGILPDPIEVSGQPKEKSHWLSYIFKAQQWIARKSPKDWSDEQKKEFCREAKPLVEAWVEAGGEL